MARRQLSEKITYRLDPYTFQQLEKLGAPFQLNAHGMARKLMQDALEETEFEQMRQEMRDLHAERVEQSLVTVQQVGQLRIDLATAVEALLGYVSDESPDNIRQWVIETLLNKDMPELED